MRYKIFARKLFKAMMSKKLPTPSHYASMNARIHP